MAAYKTERLADRRAKSGGAGGTGCEGSGSFVTVTYRTHHCAQLRKSDIGANVTLSGWVHVRRDLGGVIFIDLRDREGLTQVVFRPEETADLTKSAHSLRHEDVISTGGRVAPRLTGQANANLPTG